MTVKAPDGTKDLDAQTVSEGSTGVFEYEYTASQAGTYHYKFVSADGAAEQESFYVNKDNTT